MSEAEAEVTIAMARKGLEDPDVHRYFHYYFWYAQKPGLEAKAAKHIQAFKAKNLLTDHHGTL
ncbi:hypothetical protein E4U52_006953 [Claviceps spartinae]|nr:hypothetical protein E4U52_006953 [Claviceps spartinae]